MTTRSRFSIISRESGLLINNILLVTAMLSVFLGTLYPLASDILGMGKISVGEPYFNAVFVPIMLPAVIVMAIGGFLRWKKDTLTRISTHLKFLWVGVIALFVLSALLIEDKFVLLAVILLIWVSAHSLLLLYKNGLKSLAFLGMLLAHVGIGVFVLGATTVTQYGIEKDIKMSMNESQEIKGYQFTFKGVESFSMQNYQGYKGLIEVRKNGNKVVDLHPEKRNYTTGMPMTEAAIDPALSRDLYVALGESLEGDAWSLRIYYKPLIRLIWLGGILIALGALLAAFDRRYRIKVKVS
jgi:cytochrome c-type biogenesis protein CcmF